MGIAPSRTDPLTSLWEALTTQAALCHCARTGEGLYVDLSILESALTMMGDIFREGVSGGPSADGSPPRHGHFVPHGIYPCSGADAWIAISAGSQAEWDGLCRALDHPGWCRQEDFRTPSGRWQGRERLDCLLAAEARHRSASELFYRLQSGGVPAGPCYTLREIVKDPHMQWRGLFRQLPVDKGKVRLTTDLP